MSSFREKGLILFVLAFILGIFLSTYVYLLLSLTLLLTGIMACCLLLFTLTGNSKDSIFVMLILVAGSFMGAYLNLHSGEMKDFPLIKLVGERIEVKGTIIEEPKISKDKYRITVVVDGLSGPNIRTDFVNSGEKILLVVPFKGERVYGYGDSIKFKGKLELPQIRTNPGGFDYRQYLKRQGIGVTMSLWTNNSIDIIGHQPPNRFVDVALQVKRQGSDILRATLGKDYYPLLQGLIFGETGEIPQEVNDTFAKLGIIHILSVSGYHMVLIMGIIFFLINLFPVKKTIKFIGVVIGLTFYATMVGWSPPVTRAFIMGVGGLIGKLYQGEFEGKINWSNIIAMAMLLILLIKPQTLYDVGFQLSFTATWGIIYLTPVFISIFERARVPSQLQTVIAGTLGAQIATLPLVAYYFNFISIISLLANILTLLLVEIIIILGLLSLVLGIFHLKLALMINFSNGILSWFLYKLSFALAKFPFAIIYVKQPSYFIIIVFYLLTILLVWGHANLHQVKIIKFRVFIKLNDWSNQGIQLKGKSIAFLFGGIIIFLIFIGGYYYSSDENLKVTYIDVGQGDSILICTPKGKNILIDAGGLQSNPDFDIGAKVVAPTLLKLGVRKLDLMVITHDHFDHYGGVKGLKDMIKIDKVLVAMKEGEEGYNSLLTSLKNQGIPIVSGHRGQTLNIEGGINAQILNPATKLVTGTDSDSNNNSLVIKLTYGSTVFYFTGDIQGEIIAQWDKIDRDGLLAKNQKKIWKVPHHGSKFSNAPNFYSRLQPYWSVISVGKNNFGHPDQGIIKDLQNGQGKVFRTDKMGAIIIESDGEKIKGSWIKKGEY